MPAVASRFLGSGRLEILPLGALMLLALAVGLFPLTNNDIWLHLATGDWILENGRVPGAEVFSYAAAGRPYVAHEWGSAVLFSLIHSAAGVLGLVGWKAGMGLILAAGVYIAGRRRGASPATAALLGSLAMFVAGAHLWARPHPYTWVAVLITIALLRSSRPRPLLLALLVPLQVVWTNLHGGFVLGPVLILGWATGEAIRRWRGQPAIPWQTAAAGGAAALACLANPYGVELLRLPFELTRSPVFMGTIYEWRSPLTSSYLLTTMLWAAVLLLILLVAALARRQSRDRLDPCDLILVAGMLLLALRMSRNVPLFALVTAPVVAGALGSGGRLRRWAATAAPAALALLVMVWGYPYWWDLFRPRGLGPGPSVPVAACDYVRSRDLTGNAFTTYGEGAYVAWRLWPGVRVGMDSRNSVYGESLYLEYRAVLWNDAALASYLERWPVDLFIVHHSGPFRRGPEPEVERDHDLPHRTLLTSGRYALVHFDDISTVYVARNPGNRDLVQQDAFHIIHPVLQSTGFPPANLAAAVIEAQRAVERQPETVVGRWILANAYAQSRRWEEALVELEAMQRLGTRTVGDWRVGDSLEASRLGLVGFLESRRGHCEAAREALEAALLADPGYRPARDLLDRLDC